MNTFQLGIRSLRRAPMLTAISVITLGVGSGAATAVFSVVDGVVLEPLDHPDPHQLYLLGSTTEDSERLGSHPGLDVQFMQREMASFQAVTGLFWIRQNLTEPDRAVQVHSALASRGFFAVFRVEPVVGRSYDDLERTDVAVLSHGFWNRHFGGDESVVGRSIMLDNRPVEVIGIMPPGFGPDLPEESEWPEEIDVWRPPFSEWSNGDMWNAGALAASVFTAVGRSTDGTTYEQVQAATRAAGEAIRRERADHAAAGYSIVALPLAEAASDQTRPILFALLAAVTILMLVVAVNVASLILLRSEMRLREISVQLALGASSGRVMRAILAEIGMIAAMGVLLGVVFANGGLRLMLAMAPGEIPRLDNISLDGSVLFFSLATGAFAAMVAGVAPALMVFRRDPSTALRRESRSVASQGATRYLAVAETALAVVLLVGAGLMLRSFLALNRVDPGFRASGLLTFSVSLPSTDYTPPQGTHQFYSRLVSGMDALNEVASSAVVWPLPLEGQTWSGTVGEPGIESTREANYRVVTGGFFDVVGSPVNQGRTFQAGDQREVAVISAALANELWPDESALGRMIKASPWGASVDFEVIGVVGDIRYASLDGPVQPTIYFSTAAWSWADWEFGVVVRTTRDPLSVLSAVQGIVAGIDPGIPAAQAAPMQTYVDRHLAPTRFIASLFGVFAIVATLLASLGVYGVVRHSVNRRSREIAIRMALGAAPSRILAAFLRSGTFATVGGIAIGMVAAVIASSFLESLLFGVHAIDAPTYLGIAVLVVTIGVVASLFPARRAATVDPASALTEE